MAMAKAQTLALGLACALLFVSTSDALRSQVKDSAVLSAAQDAIRVYRDASGKLVEEPESVPAAKAEAAAAVAEQLDAVYFDDMAVRTRHARPQRAQLSAAAQKAAAADAAAASQNAVPLNVYRDASGKLVEEPEKLSTTKAEAAAAVAEQLDAAYSADMAVRTRRVRPQRPVVDRAAAAVEPRTRKTVASEAAAVPLNVYRDASGKLVEEPERESAAKAEAAAAVAEQLDAAYFNDMAVRTRRASSQGARIPAVASVAKTAPGDEPLAVPLNVFRDASGKLVEEPERLPAGKAEAAAAVAEQLDTVYFSDMAVRTRRTRPQGGKVAVKSVSPDADAAGNGPVHVFQNAAGEVVEEAEKVPAEKAELAAAVENLDALYLNDMAVRTRRARPLARKSLGVSVEVNAEGANQERQHGGAGRTRKVTLRGI